MSYDQTITLAHLISEIRRCLSGKQRDSSPKGMARENGLLPGSTVVQHTRRRSAIVCETYIHDKNPPFPKVSQPSKRADFIQGADHELI